MLRIDFTGILILFFGHAVMSYHVSFSPCMPVLEAVYDIIPFIMSVYTFYVLTRDNVMDRLPHVYMCLAAIVGYGYVPLVHLMVICYVHGLPPPPGLYSLMLGASQGSYLIGFIIFSLRVPESVFPSTFDLIGSSHQIWHVAVAAGLYFWLHGHLVFLEWRGMAPPYC